MAYCCKPVWSGVGRSGFPCPKMRAPSGYLVTEGPSFVTVPAILVPGMKGRFLPKNRPMSRPYVSWGRTRCC